MRGVLFVLTILTLLGDEKQSIVLVISCAGILGLFAYDAYVKRRSYYLNTNIFLSWAVLSLLLIASSVGSLSVGYSTSELVKYAIAFLCFVYFSNTSTDEFRTQWQKTIYIWGIMIVGLSYVFVFFPSLQLSIPRMNLLFTSYGHNHVVDILLFIIPISYSILLSSPTPRSLIGAIILIITFVTSYSRGAILLLSVYSAYFLFTHRKHSSIRFRSLLLLAVPMVIALLLLVLTFPGKPKGVKSTIFASRVQYWQQALAAVKDRPLFGWGPGTFYLISKRFQVTPNSYSWYAHSFPLQTSSDIGLIGALALSLVLFMVFARAPLKKSPIYHGALLTIIYSCIEMNIDFTVVWVLFWINLGLVFPETSNKQSKSLQTELLLPLIIVFIYYGTNVVGGISSLFPDGIRLSFYAQPYDVKRAKTFIYMNKPQTSISRSDENLLLLFHSYDPEVLMALGNKQKNINLIETAWMVDTQNTSILIEYLKAIIHRRDAIQMQKFIKYFAKKIPLLSKDSTFITFIDNTEFSRQIFSQDLISFVNTPATPSEVLSKLLYYIGFMKLAENSMETLEFWKTSRDIIPDSGQLQVELASLYWSLGDYQKAQNTLLECQKYVQSRNQCKEALVHSLPDPGMQKDFIAKIPHVPYGE